jgi:hypothetical protein
MSERQDEVNPRAMVRQFRESYLNVHEVKERVPDAFPKAEVHTPKQKPIKENELSQGVRDLLREYRQRQPGRKITLLKYQRLENGEPVLVVEDETGLPSEDELLTLSQTVTLTTAEDVRVITELVVARTEPVRG